MARELVGDQLSWWVILIISGIAFVFATEVGYRIGRRQPPEVVEVRKTHTGVLLPSLLALLGLLLAFSFSIVELRFSARKALVLEEANAIGTTYLRSEMLSAPHKARIAELLRKYVAIRLAARTPEELERAITHSEELHIELWNQAIAVGRAHPESHVVALFIQSLNDVIDLHSARVTVGLHQRLPRAILVLLYAVALLAMGVLGLNSGLTRWRSPFATGALILAVSAVVVLIIEFDRPGGRLVHISQQVMQDVQQTINTRPRSFDAPRVPAESRRSRQPDDRTAHRPHGSGD